MSDLCHTGDLLEVGSRVVEMADKLKLDTIIPGLQARQVVVIDGEPFTIIVQRGDHRESDDA